MNELPDLVTRLIWKYRLEQVFNDIKSKNHKLIYNQENNDFSELMLFARTFNYLLIREGIGGLSYNS